MSTSTSNLPALLLSLPGSYSGPTKPQPGPYGVVGVGEGTLAAQIAQALIPASLTRTGTQFVLSSPDARSAATDYGDLAEVAGANVKRISTGGTPQEIDVLVPGGPLATYHFAQFLAYATDHNQEAQDADALLADLAQQCAPQITEGNPARDLAWSLWGRQPLLLATPDAESLPHAWQQLLARTGKTLAIPLLGDLLPLVTGEFEAQHEKGDAKVALILGDTDDTLLLVREILETRIDEIIHVPYPSGPESGGAAGYASQLALWYFGAWVAVYLAERYGVDPADTPILARAQAVLSGEDQDEQRFNAPRDDLRRTVVNDETPDDEWDDRDEAFGDDDAD